jgi:hypothetical protein
MPDADKLIDFITAAKKQQASDDFIVSLLRQQGWSEDRVYAAFTQYYEGLTGQAVPKRGSRIEGAREAFFYLLAFITLGVWVVALIFLADRLIDHVFPPQGTQPEYLLPTDTATQLAAIIVSFPLFLFVQWLIAREVARRPEALESGVRKWLTYIALVVTAITLIGDAVAVITSFLTGDLTQRFLLQALVLVFIAGGVFWYYLGTVRSSEPNPARDRWFGIAATIVVVAFVIMGFVLTGSPARVRARQMDDQRLQRISEIAVELHERVAPKPAGQGLKLPSSLDQVLTLSSNDTVDPATDKPFEYIPAAAGTKYELCAVFDTDVTRNDVAALWVHPPGHHCFALDAAQEPVRYYSTNGY